MNNHLSVVGYLLQKGELQKARDYFDKISVYMQTANRKFCENSVVNAVLNAKYNLMTDAKLMDFFISVLISFCLSTMSVFVHCLPTHWTMRLKHVKK